MPRFRHVPVTADTCDWEPLERLAERGRAAADRPTVAVEDYMYMQCLEGPDGLRIHCYKHWWSRRYLNLDDHGNPWAYLPEPWAPLDFEAVAYRRIATIDEALADLDLDEYAQSGCDGPVA
jgi:hypothetical protein